MNTKKIVVAGTFVAVAVTGIVLLVIVTLGPTILRSLMTFEELRILGM